MTKEQLLTKLRIIAKYERSDTECDHINADDALLEFINDKEIEEAYNAIYKWYA